VLCCAVLRCAPTPAPCHSRLLEAAEHPPRCVRACSATRVAAHAGGASLAASRGMERVLA
jgi:hypothetical protein